mgnify:CR=1 FL=1
MNLHICEEQDGTRSCWSFLEAWCTKPKSFVYVLSKNNNINTNKQTNKENKKAKHKTIQKTKKVNLVCFLQINDINLSFLPPRDRSRPMGYCHSDVRPSICPSVRHPSLHFQLSLVARVSGVFILYYMVMFSGKTNLWFWVEMLAILNLKWLTPKLLKDIFYLVFSSLSLIFTWILYHSILEVQGQ